jgi:hypothetical protein
VADEYKWLLARQQQRRSEVWEQQMKAYMRGMPLAESIERAHAIAQQPKCRLPECEERRAPADRDGYCMGHAYNLRQWAPA